MKLLIAAGGTGGHIYPGIAVANEILARQPGSEIMFVGTARGLEKRIVPDNGFQLALIHSAGLKNVGFAGKMKGMLILPNSFREAWKILRDFRPDVVVGAGGYVSGPVLLTAHFMGFPTLVIVDQKGNVAAFDVGYSPNLHEKVSKKLDELLKAPG